MEFTNVGVILGARFGVPMEQSSLVLDPAGTVLRVFNPVAAETVRVALGAAGLAEVAGLTSHGTARVGITVEGVAASLATDLVACARAGSGVMMTGYLSAAGLNAMQAVQVMAVPVGGVDYLIAAKPAGNGIEVFRIGADLSLQRVAGVADSATIAAAGVSAMASAVVAGETVLYAASGVEHGITAFRLGSDGALTVIDTNGPAQGVPVQGITCLQTIEAGGQSWLIAGAAGSNSLTVFRIGADGAMQPVDHVIDDLATRFDGVTAMDAVTVAGRVFVVVAGADDGLSLLTLLPDGTLTHLATVADTVATGLGNVSDIALSVVDGVLQVLVLSGAEAGLTQLSVDLRGLGVVGATGTAGDDLLVCGAGGATVAGAAGRDMLMDGAGADTLAGGTGADVFVLRADGVRDVIWDFDITQDRIDLTRWTFFRNAGQLQITQTATGAILRFWGEELELRNVTGRTLAEAALRALGYGEMSRMQLGDVPLPEPPPDTSIVGTAGNDSLTGTEAGEVLSGLAGDDVILAAGGADTVDGGAGSDWLSYDSSQVAVRIDLARWTNGSPEVRADVVSAIEGFIGTALGDVMAGGKAAVLFRGGGGNDALRAGTRGGEIDGGAGDDSLTGGIGAEVLWGGSGNDLLAGASGNDRLDGGTGDDSLSGGIGFDRLAGGDGRDWLEGGDAADTLAGGAGEDILYGGAGNDTLAAEAGDDAVYGDEGDDSLDGAGGIDRLFGGAGLDRMAGGDGDDVLDGGDGADGIAAGAGDDTAYGGAGNDSLAGDAGNDLVNGDDGNDSIDGGEGHDAVSGGAGGDLVTGGAGNDTLDGGAGADALGGGWGDDRIDGGTGDDLVFGLAGNDWLSGGEGADMLGGGAGDDLLEGGAGNDRLLASVGNDTLDGGDGNDLLAGMFAADALWGGAGRDTLDGGRGNDVLAGGAQADVFVFAHRARGEVDVIRDFEDGLDRLRLSGLTGSSDAARFQGLTIRDVTIGGVDCAEVWRLGHVIRLEGVEAADLTRADFLFG